MRSNRNNVTIAILSIEMVMKESKFTLDSFNNLKLLLFHSANPVNRKNFKIFFCILGVLVSGIYGFHGNRKVPFLKITVAVPPLLAATKRILEQGFTCPGYSCYGFQAYESNIDFEIRFY